MITKQLHTAMHATWDTAYVISYLSDGRSKRTQYEQLYKAERRSLTDPTDGNLIPIFVHRAHLITQRARALGFAWRTFSPPASKLSRRVGQPRPTVCWEAGDERTTGGEAHKIEQIKEIIINNSYIKRCSLTKVKLTALYKHLIIKTTLTYISANKTLHIYQ